MTITPGIKKSKSPPLHDLDEYQFQDLCRDLLAEEPHVETCDIYGVRGQRQDGIDVIAHRADGIEVGQCKRYKSFTPTHMNAASDEFLKYWSRWSKENVKRFILFVSADLSSKKLQDSILAQKRRFREIGLTYEAWSPAQIRKKLVPHRPIAEAYLESWWANAICGPSSISPPLLDQPQSLVNTLLTHQHEAILPLLSDSIDKEIELMRTALREGHQDVTSKWISEIKRKPGYPYLPLPTRAKIIRLQASVEMDHDIDCASELINEAVKLDPSELDVIARSLIAFRRGDLDEALTLLAPESGPNELALKAAILAESGQLEEASSTLDLFFSPNNPEALRLRALICLMKGELPAAQDSIEKAATIQPNWKSIRLAEGIIGYFSTISPAAISTRTITLPEPIDWPFIKTDEYSLRRATKAAQIFAELISTAPIHERRNLQTWRIACLANHPDQQAQAADYCGSVIADDPSHPFAIFWGLARRFEIDFTASQKFLESLDKRGQLDLHGSLALAALYMEKKRYRKAHDFLQKAKHAFEEAHSESLWAFWHTQSLILLKRDASAFLEGIQHESFEISRAWVQVFRSTTENKEALEYALSYLLESYHKTNDPVLLMEGCLLAARGQNWHFVADRAEELVDRLATAEAVRLAAISTFKAGKAALCLNILDKYRSHFKAGRLTNELRGLRAHVERRRGALISALAEAKSLALDEPSVENLLGLAQIYLDSADIKSLTTVAQDLAQQPDLRPEDALTLARIVRQEDASVARALWVKATNRELEDGLVAPAAALAFEIGLDKEVLPLMSRLTELGRENKAGISIGTFEDAALYAQEFKANLHRVEEAYRLGLIPVHFACEQANTPLARVFHELLEENERQPDPRLQPCLFVRHGGRPSTLESENASWRLNLDITAVLLAQHLGILGTVEAEFGPLRIPQALPLALLRMRDLSLPSQSSQVDASKVVVGLVDSNLIRVNPAAGITAPPNSTQARSADLNKQEAEDQFTSLSTILRSLSESGILADDEQLRVTDHLGAEYMKRTGDSLILNAGQSITTAPGAIIAIAKTGLINLACDYFNLAIEDSEMKSIRALITKDERLRNLTDWIDQLVNRISRGISDGMYHLLVQPDEEEQDTHEPSSLDSKCLITLISCRAEPGDAFWIDDRRANSFLMRDSHPIITVTEVLQALKSRGSITKSHYFHTIARMRAANLRFIPIQADEILHHLRQAPVSQGHLKETRNLKLLRRYLASTLAQAAALGSSPGEPPFIANERSFSFDSSKVVSEAAYQLWECDDPEETKRARANWLIDNLYYPLHLVAQLSTGSQMHRDDAMLAALGLAGFVSNGFRLDFEPSTDSPRRHYFAWLEDSLLRRQLESNPAVTSALAGLLKGSLESVLSHRPESTDLEVLVSAVQMLYMGLPEILQEAMDTDSGFLTRIGITLDPVASIGGFNFRPDDLLHSLGESISGRHSELVSIDHETRFSVAPVSDEAVRFQSEKHSIHLRLSDELLILSDSIETREKILIRNPQWFDSPADIRARAIQQISSIAAPRQRIDELKWWQDRSATYFYEELRSDISQNGRVNARDLFPGNLDIFVKHLGLTP